MHTEVMLLFINVQIIGQRKYSKWKAAYINNCLKKGETPIPGPIGEDANNEPSTGSTGLPYPTQTPNVPPSANMYPPPSANMYPPPAAQSPGATLGYSAMQHPVQPQQQHQPVSVSTFTLSI